MEESEKAIEKVRKITPDADKYKIINMYPDFMQGSLYVVGFEVDEGSFHNFVFINGKEIYVARNDALLLSWISKKSKRLNFLEQIGGVAGIIGLVITLAIIFLVVTKPGEGVPNELWAAFTAVLAFYFGSKTSRN